MTEDWMTPSRPFIDAARDQHSDRLKQKYLSQEEWRERLFIDLRVAHAEWLISHDDRQLARQVNSIMRIAARKL